MIRFSVARHRGSIILNICTRIYHGLLAAIRAVSLAVALGMMIGLPVASAGAFATAAAAPGDLQVRLGRLGEYLKAIYAPCATRVLTVRGDQVQLEQTAGARLGDVFDIYPTGTIVIGSGATDPLPAPIARVRVVDVQADSVVAIFEGDAIALPTFAPAMRTLRDRALAIVWQPPPDDLRRLVDAWALPEKVYDVALAASPIVLTGVPPPDIPAEQMVPHPDILLDVPSTEVLTIRVDRVGLHVQWRSAFGAEVQATTIALPFRSASFAPLYTASDGEAYPGTTQNSLTVFALPMPVCDCATLPLAAYPEAELWCLTDSAIVRFKREATSLVATGSWQAAFAQQPPYRRSGAGQLRWSPEAAGWVLRAHRGQGGEGFHWRLEDRKLVPMGPIPALPVANLSPSPDTFATPDPKGVGRLLRSVELPDILPSPLIALANDEQSLASVDGTGKLQLILDDGTQLTAPGSGYGGALAVSSAGIYVSQGSRIIRFSRAADGSIAKNPTASPTLPGLPLSIATSRDTQDAELWVVVESPLSAGTIVRISAVGWKSADMTKSSRGWPVMGGDVTLGLPLSRLDLTPEGVSTLLERQLFGALYDTPVRLLPDGGTAPLVVRQISRNEEHDEWELQFQPGLVWPGGAPVTATEIKMGWEQTIRQHPLNAPAFELVEGYRAYANGPGTHLTGIEIVDERTLLIKLSEPEPKFDTYLADSTWAIVRGEERVLAGKHASLRFRQGTGPFQPVRITDDVIELGRNQWHIAGMPYLATWRWLLLGSPEAISRAALAGRLEFASLTTEEWPVLAAESRFAGSLLDQPSQATLGLLVNPGSGAMADSDVRRGLFEAVDLTSLRRITLGSLVDSAGGHFSDRLGLKPATDSNRGTPTPGMLRIAVTAEDADAMAAVERIRTELLGQDSRWKIEILIFAPSVLRHRRTDWDIALWTLSGSPHPVLTEARELRRQWQVLGGSERTSEPPYTLETTLIRGGWWRVIGHPRRLWLRSPKLRGWVGPGRAAPAWADAWWDR